MSPVINWSFDIFEERQPSKFGLGTGYLNSNKYSTYFEDILYVCFVWIFDIENTLHTSFEDIWPLCTCFEDNWPFRTCFEDNWPLRTCFEDNWPLRTCFEDTLC